MEILVDSDSRNSASKPLPFQVLASGLALVVHDSVPQDHPRSCGADLRSRFTFAHEAMAAAGLVGETVSGGRSYQSNAGPVQKSSSDQR